MLCGCDCALVFVDLEARHHLVHNDVSVVKAEFINFPSSLSEFKVSFAEVMIEIILCFVHLVCTFPRPDVVFEDSLPVEDDKGGGGLLSYS